MRPNTSFAELDLLSVRRRAVDGGGIPSPFGRVLTSAAPVWRPVAGGETTSLDGLAPDDVYFILARQLVTH